MSATLICRYAQIPHCCCSAQALRCFISPAKKLGYAPADQRLENLRAYPVEDERAITLKNSRAVMLRPATSSDAAAIRELLHCLSNYDVYACG